MPSLIHTSSLVMLPIGATASAVLGLRWQTVQPHPKAHQLLLRQNRCTHWLLHPEGDLSHYGLAALPAERERETGYSASLLLIDRLGSDWVAIVQLPNHTYGFIGVSKGQVVPGCEQVLATAAEALELFTRYQMLFQWQTVYAPSSFNLGGESLEIESLLADCEPNAAYQLQYEPPQKSAQGQWVRYGIVAGLVLSTAGGVLTHQHYAALRLAEQQRLQAQRQKQTAPILPIWCQHPPAQRLVTHCMQAIARYPLFLEGWRLETAQCDRHSARASYRWQPPYTVKAMLAGLQRDNTSYEFSSGAKVIHLKHPLHLPNHRPQEPLLPLKHLVSDLLQQLEQGGATGRIDDVFSTTKQSAHFELDSDQPPPLLLNKLSLAGVVIHTLQTTINPDGSLRWKCSGTLYGQ